MCCLGFLNKCNSTLFKARQSQTVVAKRDGATLLKEDQLFARFPTIDRHFLQDIFRDNKCDTHVVDASYIEFFVDGRIINKYIETFLIKHYMLFYLRLFMINM